MKTDTEEGFDLWNRNKWRQQCISHDNRHTTSDRI